MDRRSWIASEHQRQPPLPSQLPVRTGTGSALPDRPDARPRKRQTDWDPPHRPRATEWPSLQGRPLRPRPDGRDQALASGSQLIVGEGLETTLAAATRIPYRGAAAATGLVGSLERWLEPVAGHSRGRALDHPGRPRRQWRRASGGGALHGALDPRRAHRHSAHPQARRRRFQ